MPEGPSNLRFLISISVAGAIVGFAAAYFIFGGGLKGPASPIFEIGTPEQPLTAAAGDCNATGTPMTVSGNSMAGIVPNGSRVIVVKGYYACHDVARGDVVIYNYPDEQLVKKVFGIPGDSFALAPATSSGGMSKNSMSGWSILINGKLLVNAEGQPYIISESGHRMLALYVNDYHGNIPADAYLILGDSAGGSLDSTVFGLVAKEDFIGKVVAHTL